ncbi:hypothetical protein BHE74_00053135 [Ensete ventricosum]|nr:hypothetical protein BHE74_00053135 [Ensete ventricosum]
MSLSSLLPLLPLIRSPYLRGGGAARALKGEGQRVVHRRNRLVECSNEGDWGRKRWQQTNTTKLRTAERTGQQDLLANDVSCTALVIRSLHFRRKASERLNSFIPSTSSFSVILLALLSVIKHARTGRVVQEDPPYPFQPRLRSTPGVRSGTRFFSGRPALGRSKPEMVEDDEEY